MDPLLATHLDRCKLNEKRYRRLTKILKDMRDRAKDTDQLVDLFTTKCYGAEKDRNLAKLQASTFLEALFGNINRIMDLGPEGAMDEFVEKIRDRGREKASIKYGKAIIVDDLKKGRSVDFSAHLHETTEAKMATHPMWTRKLDKYLVGPTLGVGGTAKVKLAWDTEKNRKVALKILQPKYAFSAQKEIDILKKLDHKNVVRVYDCYDNVMWNKEERTTVFAIEYANQGELIEYLMYTSKFEDDLARWFFQSLTEGMDYCHSQNVIHRDLKHDNCLLGENFVVKITDFGFATHYYKEEGTKMKTAIGTAQYAAPEILAGKKYTESVDIFSMGVMLFIALVGSQPWRKADPRSDRWYKMIDQGKWSNFFNYHKRSHEFTDDQKTILKGILEPNPKERWTLERLKRCNWYRGKTLSQDEVAMRLTKRKATVDDKKFRAMRPPVNKNKRDADIFAKRLPLVYFRPATGLSFVTDTKAEWALEAIADAIHALNGKVTETNVDNFKLSFYVCKLVFTGKKDKETGDRETDKVKVSGSVRMWTKPGQEEALKELAMYMEASKSKTKKDEAAANDKDEKDYSSAKEQNKPQKASESFNKSEENEEEKIRERSKDDIKIPPIKSYAIFMAECSGEARILFSQVYSDILKQLPADIVFKDALMDEDDSKE